ncbi:MAG: hypothetical protein E6J67_12650 [Deltaproteobacteria bacterium]|nr:MAG: hypothetical protein E6J67_12650 [Deltaproteobacteria bacterium]
MRTRRRYRSGTRHSPRPCTPPSIPSAPCANRRAFRLFAPRSHGTVR